MELQNKEQEPVKFDMELLQEQLQTPMDPPPKEKPECVLSNQSGQSLGHGISMKKAVIWSEILDKPISMRRRMRYR